MTTPNAEPPEVRLRRIEALLASTTSALAVADHEARMAAARLAEARTAFGWASRQSDVAQQQVHVLGDRRDGLLWQRDHARSELGAARPAPPTVPIAHRPRAETSYRTVQVVLLALGGALLAVAAIVFTVVAWSAFGIGGRAAILSLVTLITLCVPMGLHRIRLDATAETVGLLALVLVGLDGYAAWGVGWVPGVITPTGYAGAVLAVVALLAACYPLVIPLRTVRPAAVLLLHPSTVLLAWPVVGSASGWALVGLFLVGTDLLIRRVTRTPARGCIAGIAGIMATLAAAGSVVLALAAITVDPNRTGVAAGIVVLAGIAAAALLGAETLGTPAAAGLAGPAGIAAGSPDRLRWAARLIAAALAAPLIVLGPSAAWIRFAPGSWPLSIPTLLVCAAAAVTLLTGGAWRVGSASAALALAIVSSWIPILSALAALLSPVGSPHLLWRAGSAAETAHTATDGPAGWDTVACAVVATAAVALALAALARVPGLSLVPRSAVSRPVGRAGLLILAVPIGLGVLSLLVPPAMHAPIWLATGLPAVAAAVALVASAPGRRTGPGRERGADRSSGGIASLLAVGTVLGLHALVVALSEQWTTLALLAAAAAGAGALAAGRAGTSGIIPGAVREAYLTGVSLAALTGLSAAATLTATGGRDEVWTGSTGWHGLAGLSVTVAGLVALGVAWGTRTRRPASAVAAAAVAGAGGLLGPLLAAIGAARPAVALFASLSVAICFSAARVASNAGVRLGVAAGPPAAGALPIVAALPGLVVAIATLALPAGTALFGPLGWTTAIWSGAPDDSGVLMPVLRSFPGTVLDPVAMLVLALILAGLVLATAVPHPDAPAGRAFRSAALWWTCAPVVALGLIELAPSLRAPWPVGLAMPLVLAALAALAATGGRATGRWVVGDRAREAAATIALSLGLSAIGWSLADRAATLILLGITVALTTGLAAVSRAGRPRQGATAAAAAATTGLAVAAGAAASVPLACTLLGAAAVLVAPTLLALAGRPVPPVLPPEVGTILEAFSLGTAALAVALSPVSPPPARGSLLVLAVTLTLLGGGAGVVALRPDRRILMPFIPATETFALWAWLAQAHVTTVEAYTLPAAVLGGVAGLLTLGRRPELSSWVAVGPALAVAVIPTGVIALESSSLGLRALLLGICAAAVLLIGVAYRRQAPFVTGAVVLGALAARTLAIALPVFADEVPAWVPLTVGGLLLLGVGATYEQRRRDAVKFGAYVRHMR